MDEKAAFWATKNLEDFNEKEWESVCDGCARCCLQKLQDSESGLTFFTRVACRLLDTETCRCKDYLNRFDEVPDCTRVAPLTTQKRNWLPHSCAYLKLDRGEALDQWHPLVSLKASSVHESGMSVRGWAVAEDLVDEDQYESLLIEFDDDEQPVALD